jgi:hypothetical protein
MIGDRFRKRTKKELNIVVKMTEKGFKTFAAV